MTEEWMEQPLFGCKHYDGMCSYWESYMKGYRTNKILANNINPCTVFGKCVGVAYDKSEEDVIEELDRQVRCALHIIREKDEAK